MIENQTSIARYTGNGTITEFSIPFSFYKNADGAPETYQVAVYQRDKGQAERKLDQGTDYSVTWEEATLSGKIVLATALPNESVLAIIREVPPSQEVEYKANEPFPYDGTNTALDKLTMLVQEHEEALSRKLGVTPTYDKTAEETMADVINAKESAEASAAAAKASADEAKGYAQEAENAKVGAVEAKDLAVEAADSAELYAQNAEDSKQGADAALSQLNNQVALAQAAATEANAAKQSAQTSADQASSSAQEAKTSEDTAAQQATEATNAQKEATRASISCAVNEQRTLSYYNEVKRLADVFNAEPATDTTYGFTRYATEAEAEAGELNNVSSTPAQVKKAADKAADKAAADSKTYADNVVASHAGNTSNPHNVTKAQVGLGNVDNTSDLDKPVSTAVQEALDNLKSEISSEVGDEYLPLTGGELKGNLTVKGNLEVTGSSYFRQIFTKWGSNAKEVAFFDVTFVRLGNSGLPTQLIGSTITANGERVLTEADPVLLTTDKGVADGVASLDSSGKVPIDQVPDLDYVKNSDKAVAGGVASLDSDGKVPDSQLPETVLPDNYDYVVESYTDAETGQWYRVYKSGWIEQGGGPVSYGSGWGHGGTVNLLKEMANQKYMVTLTFATTTSFAPSLACTGRNVTSFSWQKDADNESSYSGNFIWMVVGQGA